MKIALVYPPFTNSIRTTLPKFVDETEGVFPPLGIMYIASYLKKYRPSDEILVIDSVAENLTSLQIAEKVCKFGANIVGISCWTFSLIDTLHVSAEIKKKDPKTLICLGGPHINIYPKETLANRNIDFVIKDDGEKPFLELLNQLEKDSQFNFVPNLFYKKNNKIEESPVKYIEKDLDNLVFPDRKLININNYYSILDEVQPITTMITSRGCPYSCSFCFKQKTGWRYRSVKNILEEIEYCIDLGIHNFFIFDETFTVNKKRILDFCSEIKKRNLNIIWSCRARVDTVDEKLLDNLKSAGCIRISFGIESVDSEVQKCLNKRVNLQQVLKIFQFAKKRKITTLADFMLGCPKENLNIAYQTINFAITLNPDYVQFSLLTLFPFTRLYNEALNSGVISSDVWYNFATNPDSNFKPPLWNTYSESEANKLLVIAYKMFYFRISYILKKLMSIRSLLQFKIYLKTGFELLKSFLSHK